MNKMALAISNEKLLPILHQELGIRFLTAYQREINEK